MTTEEMNLLLEDLSARFPYRVKCELLHCGHRYAAKIIGLNNFVVKVIIPGTSITKEIPITDVKLFLFPLSSMTEEQEEEYHSICMPVFIEEEGGEYLDTLKSFDWLNSHHFDYRGLIEKGLAIDATDLNIY